VALEVNPPPSLETILGLHNLKWKSGKEPQSQPRAKEAAIAFAEFHVSPDSAWEWRSWCEKVLATLKQPNKRWKTDQELNQKSILEVKQLSSQIIDVLCHYLDFDKSSKELDLIKVREKYDFQNLEEVCQWLDGVWLEEYVLSQVQNVATQFDFDQSVMSLHIEDPNNPNRTTDQFEFDVAFLRGYQLFGISCTTSAIKSRCKQKLFEAILRARQLGGDEARIALVSCVGLDRNRNYLSARPEWLKQDVNLAISDRKIEVFGREDLTPAKFSRKLTSWIQQNI
jgi:hypothetical protein